LAYVETGAFEEIDGAGVQVDIAGRLFDGTLSAAAAFDPKGRRMRLLQETAA